MWDILSSSSEAVSQCEQTVQKILDPPAHQASRGMTNDDTVSRGRGVRQEVLAVTSLSGTYFPVITATCLKSLPTTLKK
jgi:hypothetical protein